MSEGTTVEAAIRAWEQARVTEDAAREAVFEARAALAMANRALDEARAREDEARSAAISMMASGDDGPVGWIVDGCMYYPIEGLGEIRSIRIVNLASESPTPAEPAEEPYGRWTPCNIKCPGCRWVGRAYYRPMEFDYRLRCERCGHAWRSGTIDEKGAGACITGS